MSQITCSVLRSLYRHPYIEELSKYTIHLDVLQEVLLICILFHRTTALKHDTFIEVGDALGLYCSSSIHALESWSSVQYSSPVLRSQSTSPAHLSSPPIADIDAVYVSCGGLVSSPTGNPL